MQNREATLSAITTCQVVEQNRMRFERRRVEMLAYAKQEKAQPPRLTPEAYLKRERDAETKSEYDDGLLTAMSGASLEHNMIASNIQGILFGQLHGGICRPLGSDMRVRVPECNRYFYPDMSVVCGKPVCEMLVGVPSLLNPTLVVEVLSASTAERDLGEKWECYQTLESLQAYVLVAQNRSFIALYRRQENGWLYSSTNDLQGVVSLDAIGCQLRLADVYDGVEFPALEIQNEREEEKDAEEKS
jgi:Uma2 family endonuclease